MLRILILIAIIILIGLVISRWIYPFIYEWLNKDRFEIKKDMDETDEKY